MAILPVLTIPHPGLKKIAAPVQSVNLHILKLVNDMLSTMHRYRHCVGLAAPQTGRNLRIIVVDVSLYHKPHPNHGLVTLINPVILERSGKRCGREGCLSVPELTGNVCRAEHIVLEGLTPGSNTLTIETSGFEAVVFQHEIDHLDGILFLDRVASLKTDVFRRKKIDNIHKKG